MANSLTSNSSQYPLTTFSVNAIKVPPFIPMMRAPTTEDKELAGSRWQDNSVVPPLQYWTTGEGVWYLLGTGTSGLDSLTGDDAIPVLPSLGNINVQGGATGAIAFTSGGLGQLNATVQVDNTTIEIDGSGNLHVIGAQVSATVTTVGAVTATLFTIPLGAVPGTYTFDISVAGYDFAGGSAPAAVGYTLVGAVRTTGAAAVLVPGQALDEFEDTGLALADVTLGVAGNNAVVTVLGVAGESIRWKGSLDSTFQS